MAHTVLGPEHIFTQTEVWRKEKRQYDDRFLPQKHLGIGALDMHRE